MTRESYRELEKYRMRGCIGGGSILQFIVLPSCSGIKPIPSATFLVHFFCEEIFIPPGEDTGIHHGERAEHFVLAS